MGLVQSTWEFIKSTCQSILDAICGRRRDWQERYDEYISSDDQTGGLSEQVVEGPDDSVEDEQKNENIFEPITETGNQNATTPISWQEKLRKLGLSVSPKYFPEEIDIQLRKKCDDYLQKKFPNGFEYYYYNSTFDERLEMVSSITQELCTIYAVRLSRVNLYTPTPGSNPRTIGYYNPTDNSINMNASYLFRCDYRSTAEVFLGILHELKHARQWSAIQGWQDYGYSHELLYEWALNWRPGNYIEPEESDEGYRTQPLEFDAYAFGDLFTYLFFPQRS